MLTPERTSTNIRTYSEVELKKLLQANVLYTNGYKISKIAAFSNKQVLEEIEKLSRTGGSNNVAIEGLTMAMIEMNELRFDEILDAKITEQGLEKTMTALVYHFLERIGVLWITGVIEPAQEHFISNLIRQKIIVAINNLEIVSSKKKPICLAFLHQEEMHELGLLFYTYQLKSNGYNVIYLGQMTPYSDVLNSSKINKPDLVLTSFVKTVEQDWLDKYVNQLCDDFSFCNVLISGIGAAKSMVNSKNLFKISSSDHLKEVVLSF
jgi:methanogenic corrinoid protein MtbC1